MIAFIPTNSPNVKLPSMTPKAAKTITDISPAVIKNACPKFNSANDTPV